MTSEAEKDQTVPEASCLCSFQGSMQAFARPGMWIPCIRSLHLYEESWTVSANPIVSAQDVQQAVSQLRTSHIRGNVFTVSYVKELAEKSEVEVLVYSKMRYVFVIKCQFEAAPPPGGTIACVRSFVSGIMPVCCPMAIFFSCLLFFLPFPDFGFSKTYVKILRQKMTVPVVVTKSGRKC